MQYEIMVGDYRLGMLDKVEIHRSVELLSDTATIKLPSSEYNKALEVEDKLRRGDAVLIRLGYAETGLVEEFRGYLLRVSTDGGSITLHCEDDLYHFRRPLKDEVLKGVKLSALLDKVIRGIGASYQLRCTYDWTYAKFVIHSATGYDVLKKVQEECGADIYLSGDTLHIHPPGEVIGRERYYDFASNIEREELSYRKAEDKRFLVRVKALLPDGKVKEIEIGATGGDKIEIKSPTSDTASMRARAEAELKRRSYDGYEGSITTWLVPVCHPGDMATLRDRDYPYKDGSYFVVSVTTEMSKGGGRRQVELGYRLS